jgi:hypothetical protein
VVATKDSMHKKMDSVIQQLLARAAKLYIVCNEGDEGMGAYEKQGCQLIRVSGCLLSSTPVCMWAPSVRNAFPHGDDGPRKKWAWVPMHPSRGAVGM